MGAHGGGCGGGGGVVAVVVANVVGGGRRWAVGLSPRRPRFRLEYIVWICTALFASPSCNC